MTPLVDRRPAMDELLRLAEAATPKHAHRWVWNGHHVPSMAANEECSCGLTRAGRDAADRDFRAAANPQVVAALIRENRQQAERIARLERAAHRVSAELKGTDGRPFSVSLAAELDHVLRESRP